MQWQKEKTLIRFNYVTFQVKCDISINEDENWYCSQTTITCSKLTTKTLEQGVKYLES